MGVIFVVVLSFFLGNLSIEIFHQMGPVVLPVYKRALRNCPWAVEVRIPKLFAIALQ